MSKNSSSTPAPDPISFTITSWRRANFSTFQSISREVRRSFVRPPESRPDSFLPPPFSSNNRQPTNIVIVSSISDEAVFVSSMDEKLALASTMLSWREGHVCFCILSCGFASLSSPFGFELELTRASAPAAAAATFLKGFCLSLSLFLWQ